MADTAASAVAPPNMPWYMWVLLIAFLATLVMNYVMIGKATGNSESQKETANAITTITVMNGILTAVLGVAAFVYANQRQAFERPYLMIVVHVALLLSIISMSTTSIQQLNTGATGLTTAAAAAGNCPAS